MQVLRSIEDLSTVRGPIVLAAGVFDGLHVGHQAVLGAAMASAREISGSAVALTFDPHPSRILNPSHSPRLLTSTPHKMRLMEAFGFEYVLLVKFDHVFASTEAVDFVKRLGEASRPLAGICVGEGWKFGHHRRGDGKLLRQLGADWGFGTTEVAPVRVAGQTVSSTKIRGSVASGDLLAAREFLGRDYSVFGTVLKGEGLGHQIGFPTANLSTDDEQFPPDGVYAVRVGIEGELRDGVANIGTRPTVVDSGRRLLEVNIFDFSGDLYGTDIEVVFCTLLRGEKKFSGIEALSAQICIDVDEARIALANVSRP